MNKALEDHIAATVASWPPPTPEEVRAVVRILYGEKIRGALAAMPEDPRVTRVRQAEADLAKVQREYADAMDGCHGCGISKAAHKHQEGYGLGYHPFQPLSPDAAIKVAKAYKQKIAEAQKALEDARI